MGTKRVGLARMEALMENLSRNLDLNGSRFTELVGAELVDYSTVKTIDVAQANYDVALTIPANAMITDIGYICTTEMDAASGTTIAFSAGLAASFTDVITNTQVNQTNADIDAGVVQSAMSANIPHASGTAIPTFLPAVALFATTERTLNIRIVIGGADLSVAGAYRGFAKYVIITDVTV